MSIQDFYAARWTVGRPRIGSVTLSAITALYVLLVLNSVFWKKGYDYLVGGHAALPLLAVGLAAALTSLFIAFSVKYVTKPFLIVMVIGSAVAAYFMNTFGVIIDKEMIRNAFDTTTAEANNLVTPQFLGYVALFGLLPSALIAFVRVEHRTFGRKVLYNAAVALPLLGVFTAVAFLNFNAYAAGIRGHKDWFATLNPVFPIAAIVGYVIDTGEEADIVAAPLGRDAHVTDAPGAGNTAAAGAPARKPRLTVLVVGETGRAQNFSLGGYERETNPELSKRDILYFPEVTSCGTATAVSVPCMFSVYPRQQYSHSKSLATENLVDVLGHAGVDVVWWDNDSGSKQQADRIGERDFFKMDDPRYCVEGECRDTIMLDELDGFLKDVKKDTVLVIHQIGSHGPSYYKRYDESQRRFTPDCRTPELAKCSQQELINAYDNTIIATDQFVAGVIDRLSAHQGTLDPALLYLSDHGESLGEYGVYLHGAPYMIAPPQQTHVPFLFWFGSTAKAKLDPDCLKAEAAKPQSQDNVFHSMLGLMHVETSVRDPKLDLVTACRTSKTS
ncbi:phosphoethanolamine transferase [Rhizobium halophytocola]|uniref:Lipid A ethanolaminephosphotransferase n=1 Tax=Rhizobium halophytocola TaxID=735519 RepID=A0ABS4DVW7_9HYPH|nr:phosphoethanolamine--lipid A transferase [Rhizobium halophytocola]MBP1849836.1 lipid A ethanolaminephosphotransferase [Rhizobium halophytocola]